MEPKSEKLRLFAALFVVVFLSAGFHIASKIALNLGVTKIVYLVYRNISALLILGPLAYFSEKNERPALTFSLLVQFFLLGFIGVTATQGLYVLGLSNVSSTFLSVMQNSIPAYAFVLASLLRLEQVHFMRRDSMAKILGTIVTIGGATIIILYKGPPLLRGNNWILTTTQENRTLGCLYLIFQCLSYAAWLVLQAPVVKTYPAKLSFVSFACFFGLIQLLVIAAFAERDLEHWRIRSSEEVIVILYAGIVNSGIVTCLMTWTIQKGGPVITATFMPVQNVLVAVMAFVLLGDQLYSGLILGGIVTVAGLYLVLWGKIQEEKISIHQDNEETTLREHLLDHQNTEEHRVTLHNLPN